MPKNQVRVKSQIERARRKRRARLMILSSVCVLLIAGALWFIYAPNFAISKISINNDTALNDAILEGVVRQELSERYFYLFPKKNILIYPKSSIRNKVRSMSWEVLSVNIKRSDANSIVVDVENRVPYAIWCKAPSSSECFFVDKNGSVFLPATEFSKKLFPLLVGGIKGGPLGQKIEDRQTYRNVLSFVSFLEESELNISYTHLDGADASVKLASGGSIIFDALEVEEAAQNIKALLEAEEVKEEGFGFDSIEYVDVRYGSKVFWKPRN
jgi:cell division septal protein FtsQ